MPMCKDIVMILIAIFLFLVLTPVWANWSIIGKVDSATSYIDRTTIRKNGQFVRVWELIDFNQRDSGIESGSFKVQKEYDCKEKKYSTLALIRFSNQMGTGNMIYSHAPPKIWDSVSPASHAEFKFNLLCHKWVKVAEDINKAFYLDSANILKNGQFVKIWLLIDLNQRNEESGAFSVRYQKEFECERGWYRDHRITAHSSIMATGDIIFNNSQASEWGPLNDEARGLLDVVCD